MSTAALTGLQASLFGASQRLHIQHGPTDLVIDADGPDRLALFEVAVTAMGDVLAELAEELALLRAPWNAAHPPAGTVARRMHAACDIAGELFVTPMAAVAGAIADHVLAAMLESEAARSSSKISVNNGGDIAFWTGEGAITHAAISSPAIDHPNGCGITLRGPTAWRGMATSGFGGRSLSPGIADSVTVLADCAATADVAATLIAGAVDCPDTNGIRRRPAHDIHPDSDLGARLVTVEVPPLEVEQIASALEAGRKLARRMMQGGRLAGAVLELQGEITVVGLDDPTASLTGRNFQRQIHEREELTNALFSASQDDALFRDYSS
ncbi:UPF0280 family protein [Alphaproteobacteria bacterium LSUCC0684]